jgi:hypothetical protein
MNAEIISKTVEAAQSAIDALRTSPVVLALVILQFITIGSLLYVSIERQKGVNQLTSELHELLSKCITRP